MPALRVVFVHGWGVHDTSTYGRLPQALAARAAADGIDITIDHIWLGKYVSFHDEVRLADLARGFDHALKKDLTPPPGAADRFVAITHSTGGPVLRTWWRRYCRDTEVPSPMSHLIMLAPANFGSALAQLGKGRLSRIVKTFQGVEPGQGVLDWLELGSNESWELNRDWVTNDIDPADSDPPVYFFALTGQSIDRKLYDSLNTYTGEMGSDGVVRVPSANLNAGYVRLVVGDHGGLQVGQSATAPPTAFRLIPGVAHTGDDIGIIAGVAADDTNHPTVVAVMRCLKVASRDDYRRLSTAFEAENDKIVEDERVEEGAVALGLFHKHFMHDRTSMLVARVVDTAGYPVSDFDLLFTGRKDDPNRMPVGFMVDRQRNSLVRNCVTFHVNYDLMAAFDRARDPNDKRRTLRASQGGVRQFGVWLRPRPQIGFVHYREVGLPASAENLELLLRPMATTLLEIVLPRVVHEGVFLLTQDLSPHSFKKQTPGDEL